MRAVTTKPRAPRGRPRKPRPELVAVDDVDDVDDDEKELPKIPTRATRSSRKPRKRPNQGGSSPGSHNLVAQENGLVFDDHSWSPSSGAASDDGTFRHYERKNRRGSRLVEPCQTSSDVKRRRSTMDGNDLVVVIGSSPPPSPSAQFAVTPLGQDVPNHGGSQNWSPMRGSHFEWVKDLFRLCDQSGKSSQFASKLTQFLDYQKKEAQVKIAELEDERMSLHEVISVLQSDETVLQKTNYKLSAKIRRLEQRLGRKRKAKDSDVAVHPTKNGHSLCRKQILQKDAEIQSLKDDITELTMRLQQTTTASQRCESDYVSLNSPRRQLCWLGDDSFAGSYADGSATPNQLHTALCTTKAAVTRFQMEFAIASTLLEPKVVFLAEPYHLRYFVRAGVYKLLFKGFESESFDTWDGFSRFLDPELRRAKFFEYYIREESSDCAPEIMGDPQFEEFYGERVSKLWETLHESDGKSLEEIGWTPKLESSFKDAARSVWLLHKLAFAFEPPVSIFRVRDGADFDPKYMELVVDRDEDERFIPKVGTMIAPGLRLRNFVIRCQVYLAGATATAIASPSN